ncbi:MAG TPA: TIGR03087 family PEP-CTERM/XrtA system glycosyltransferase [Anaerolineales bacterium]|nr:TIGR03087 family PEP-CTERM/XrtA system glycosyltransferase [Anaerolineales bacterium]
MRILCLTARLPYPPNRGDRLRAYNFIKSLARQHEIHLLSFIADESEYTSLDALKTVCTDVQVVHKSTRQSVLSVASNIWRDLPLQAIYYRSDEMQRLVDQKLSSISFDAAYIHLFRMAQFLANHPELYRIVDLTDVISREVKRSLPYRGLASRLLYTIERPRIQRYEQRVAQSFDETWLISNADHQELAVICPEANIQVVTNGVDFEHFYPNGQAETPDSIIFSGHMGVAHNVDAAVQLAQNILPLIRQQVSECTLQIVGAEPNAEVLRLAAIPGVSVAGFVPDLNSALNNAAVFAAPLRFAAGIQNKVLEAMATARAVVTTSVVNEGLGAEPGHELLIADNPKEIADHIIRLLQNPTQRSQIGQAAQAFVRQRYSWNIVLERIQTIAHQLPQGK